MKKRKKLKKTFKVYCTYFPNGDYYIGFSTKMGTAYENYFGSSRHVQEYSGELWKETIAEYDKRAYARMAEFLLQWENRHDPKCLNSMINVRLRLEHLKDFEKPDWKPNNQTI